MLEITPTSDTCISVYSIHNVYELRLYVEMLFVELLSLPPLPPIYFLLVDQSYPYRSMKKEECYKRNKKNWKDPRFSFLNFQYRAVKFKREVLQHAGNSAHHGSRVNVELDEGGGYAGVGSPPLRTLEGSRGTARVSFRKLQILCTGLADAGGQTNALKTTGCLLRGPACCRVEGPCQWPISFLKVFSIAAVYMLASLHVV